MLALSLCLNIAHANSLIITGVPDELAENIQLVAGDMPTNPRLVEMYTELLPTQIRKALSVYGYYEPEIFIEKNTVDGVDTITANIIAGLPVLITSINVQVNGEGKDDLAFKAIVDERMPLKTKEVFLSANYEATKGLLLDAAQAKGYFNFKFVTNTAVVSRMARTATINLVADSGPRFTFGQLRFDQDVFSDTFLNRWVPFSPNDPYDSAKLAELTQNLQNSGYFSTVRVSPQRDVRYGPTVPIRIALEKRDSNQVGIGIGFEEVEGIRGKLTWGKPLINRQGHSADFELSLSRISQEASFSYRIPRENQPLYNYWGIEYGIKVEDTEDVKSLLSTLNFQRVRRFESKWIESVFIRWERERSNFEGDEFDTDLVLPGIRYSRNRSKGQSFPTWGQSSSFQFMYGNRELLSTIDFYKATVNFKYLRAVSPRNTIIYSLQYGAITTNDFTKVPASQRFFAGGDRSIRGFKYRSVSPTDLEGNLKGGRYMEAGSAEYNYRFADRWSFAVFTDIGRAFNNFSTSQKIGAGVGIRWQSPVGPFRLDLAMPVKDSNYKDIRLHLSLGPEL